MKKVGALFTIGTSVFFLATPQVKAQVSKTDNGSIDNYKTNNINPNFKIIDLQNNLDKNLGQVTNVNSLQDVSPTDWAYQALANLVNRYGCIAGFPDRTFKGSQPLSRYEFAAGLNSCLNQIERLIASNDVGSEDLATIERLSQQFEQELESLSGRVDNLDERTALLEDNQFSTTTKLNGQAIFSLSGATGGNPDLGDDPQIVFNNRLRLDLNTSFSGQDLLITGLQAYNFGGEIDGSGSVQNSLFPNESLLTAGSTKLSFEPLFPRFNPQDLGEEVESNSVELYKLLYIFPSGLDKLSFFAGTAAEATDAFPTIIIPFADEGQGAVSRFAALNPVLRVSGGTSQTGLASATGFIFNASDKIDWRALYASVNAAVPEKGDNNILGAGVFSGSMLASTQLTLKPTDSIDLGLNYAYSYHEINILATGVNRFSATPLAIPNQTVNEDGTVNVGGILDTPVHIHSVGTSFNWNILPSLAFTGYGSYFFVDSVSGAEASSEFLSWMTGVQVRDLLKEGSTAGLIFGQPLNRVDAGGAAVLTEPDVDRGIPYHLELFYNYKVNDNISLTPGVFVLFNPEGNKNNDTTTVGVLRTTFGF